MKILITGAHGMLGRTLVKHLTPRYEVAAVGRQQCDITQAGAVQSQFSQIGPQVVLHCAAVTDVDGCEGNGEAAYRANAIGSANVAAACHRIGARLVAFSTDYVFDGQASRPYQEQDATNPQCVYGQTKLAGELAIRAHCPDHLILRIAWLYGAGGPSFVHAICKLAAQAGEPLRVVADQRGNPTSCDAVAEKVSELLLGFDVGTWHLTCQGEATRYQWARAIIAACGFNREVVPCTSAEFPRPARRPANSCLDNRELRLRGGTPLADWQTCLEQFLASAAELCRRAG
jgi:dTDP-4-dehydrorhamnose reductase